MSEFNFPGTVLLVDDESHIRKYLRLILRPLGLKSVVEAANGVEAVAAVKREKPALVLLDINMPQMGGLETLEAIKALDPECVVIMLTSLAGRGTVERAAAGGAAHYLRKDATKEEIEASLIEVLRDNFPNATTQ